MDRAFAIEFQNELDDHWLLADNNGGNTHVVMYNMDLLNPEITYAWGNLRHFYDLKGEHRVYFRYVGDNCFHINVYMNVFYFLFFIFIFNLLCLYLLHSLFMVFFVVFVLTIKCHIHKITVL